MNYQNIINNGVLLYASHERDAGFRTWSLKQTKCDICYYTTNPLEDIDQVICSIIIEGGGKMRGVELATILGFNVKDDFKSYPYRYEDVAEIELFIAIARQVETWGLIKSENNISKVSIPSTYTITELGKRAIQKNEKYKFYSAQKCILENINQEENKELQNFPFYEALGWDTAIISKKELDYEKIDFSLFEREKSKLVRQFELQSDRSCHIYFAEKTRYFEICSRLVDIRLYQYKNIYYPIVFHNNAISIEATILINGNHQLRDNKIEWGRWLNILNNPNAVLDFQTINEFEDIIDFDTVLGNSRTKWEDSNLFHLIASKAKADQWSAISKYCPFDVIKLHIEEYSLKWDWLTLSLRTEDDYLIETAGREKFHWDLECVSSKPNLNIEVIKKLLLLPNLKEEQWDWDIIMPMLGNEFIKTNIDAIDFDLSLVTADDVGLTQSLLPFYPDKRWDWSFITKEYDLCFLYEHINVIGAYINLPVLLDRIFTSEEKSDLFLQSDGFKSVIQQNKEKLHSYSANSKNYVWTPKVINFFEEYELISWDSTNNVRGFECNPYLIWDFEFFEKFHCKITTTKGFEHLSKIITLPQVVACYLDFPWDWDILSGNDLIVSDDKLVIDNAIRFNWRILLSHISDKVIENLFKNNNLQDFLQYDDALWDVVTTKVSDNFIRQNLELPWNWRILTKRFFSTIKIKNIGDERWVNKWDWHFLTQNLSIEDIVEQLDDYIDYWDWDCLTSKLDIEFIKGIIPEYNRYWNWEILLSRLRSADLGLGADSHLIEVATCIDEFEEEEQIRLWRLITRIFPFEELERLINSTCYFEIFKWDYEYFYNHDEFDLISYIENNAPIVRWDILSCSHKLNEELKWHEREEGRTVWENRTRDLIENEGCQWNFKFLSRIESINSSIPILMIQTSEWDWNFLSEFGFKNNFNEITRAFYKYLNYKILSSRKDIKLEQKFIEKNIDKWDFRALSSNSSAQFDLDFVVKHKEKDWDWKVLSCRLKKLNTDEFLEMASKPWDWEVISKRTDLTYDTNFIERLIDKWDFRALSSNLSAQFDLDFVVKHKEKDWDWKVLSCRLKKLNTDKFLEIASKPWDWEVISKRTDLIFNENFIEMTKGRPLDWFAVSGSNSFVPSKNVLDILSGKNLNWDAISKRNLPFDVISSYKNKLNWTLLSENKSLKINESNLKTYKDYWDWNSINSRDDFIISNEILDFCSDKIDWGKASASQDIDFSDELVDKYKEHWDWKNLRKNPQAQKFLSKYQAGLNCADFLERFDNSPFIYHFTHLYNALDIIKTRKILSRDKAEGRFSNSAGRLVDRRSTAHRFARFYFRPQTLTQFYNECLGWDSELETSWGKSYYPKAVSMGLPKCPMPVFFKFDLAEVIRTMPSKCYYSDGNLQTDWAQIFKVEDNPFGMHIDYLYKNINDAYEITKTQHPFDWDEAYNQNLRMIKRQSQQEFLVAEEFDFSKLNSFQIICYDEEQEKILRKYLQNDSICEKITCGVYVYGIYHQNNKKLSFKETGSELCISSDYHGNAYFSIRGELDNIEIINPDCIKKETNSEIIVYPMVKFAKGAKNINIHFIDNKADVKDWLIYKS